MNIICTVNRGSSANAGGGWYFVSYYPEGRIEGCGYTTTQIRMPDGLSQNEQLVYIRQELGADAVFQSEYQAMKLQQQQAAEAEASRLYWLQKEKEELSREVQYLNSNTAVWGQDTYTSAVAETTAEIRAFNADVAAFLATAPAGEVQQAQQAGVSIQSKPAAQASAPGTAGEKKDNTGIIIAGVAIAVVAGAIILGGRK